MTLIVLLFTWLPNHQAQAMSCPHALGAKSDAWKNDLRAGFDIFISGSSDPAFRAQKAKQLRDGLQPVIDIIDMILAEIDEVALREMLKQIEVQFEINPVKSERKLESNVTNHLGVYETKMALIGSQRKHFGSGLDFPVLNGSEEFSKLTLLTQEIIARAINAKFIAMDPVSLLTPETIQLLRFYSSMALSKPYEQLNPALKSIVEESFLSMIQSFYLFAGDIGWENLHHIETLLVRFLEDGKKNLSLSRQVAKKFNFGGIGPIAGRFLYFKDAIYEDPGESWLMTKEFSELLNQNRSASIKAINRGDYNERALNTGCPFAGCAEGEVESGIGVFARHYMRIYGLVKSYYYNL